MNYRIFSVSQVSEHVVHSHLRPELRRKKEQKNERQSSKKQVRIRSWKTQNNAPPCAPKPQHPVHQYAGTRKCRPLNGNLTCFPFNRNKSPIVEGAVFIGSKFSVSNSMMYWGVCGGEQPAFTRHRIQAMQMLLRSTVKCRDVGEEFTTPGPSYLGSEMGV